MRPAGGSCFRAGRALSGSGGQAILSGSRGQPVSLGPGSLSLGPCLSLASTKDSPLLGNPTSSLPAAQPWELWERLPFSPAHHLPFWCLGKHLLTRQVVAVLFSPHLTPDVGT